MNVITDPVIKRLCGEQGFERGSAYYRAGRVRAVKAQPDGLKYEALVRGSLTYEVSVVLGEEGEVSGRCECPAYLSYERYCKHIAALLLHVQAAQEAKRPKGVSYKALFQRLEDDGADRRRSMPDVSGADVLLMNGMLGLFQAAPVRPTRAQPRFESRTPLAVEWTCSLLPYGYRRLMFGLEMRVGPKRLYVVQRIQEFLESVESRRAYAFSKHFTYDPELHSFPPEQDALLKQLYQIVREEKLYRESSGVWTPGYGQRATGGDRALRIPPSAWETVREKLMGLPSVRLDASGFMLDPDAGARAFQYVDEPLPLRFVFDESPAPGGASYQLAVEGLAPLTILEDYGVVIGDAKLYKLEEEPCRRLAELRRMLEASRKERLSIVPEQMEPFLEKVVPGLMKLGKVEISQTVSDRIVRTPLKARLYLDRVKDRLLAGLEFHYGELVVNPLDSSGGRGASERILMRDGERERRILELMESAGFARTDAGYFLEEEEAEYEFLYRVVPELEQLLVVYASTAVKARIHPGPIAPKVKVDVDERTDWLAFEFDLEGIPETEIREVLRSLSEKRKYHRLPGGALMPLETEALQDLMRFFNDTGFTKQELARLAENGGAGAAGEFRLPVARGIHLMDMQEQGKSVRLGKSLRKLLDHMRNPDTLDFPVPPSLAPILRDYQVYGYQWMKTLAHYRFGGILADDMGLGKTLQSITFLVSVLQELRKEGRPALIVAPASLVYNWRNELKRFAPEVRAVIVDGSPAEREALVKRATGRAAVAGVEAGAGVDVDVDVLITSYPLLRRDVALYAKVSFHTMFLDEAQMFKNYATQTAQSVKSVQARYRFALTGTPVENRLEELWSIFDCVFPELFPGRRAFNDLERETIARRIRPFLLRRVKSDVLKELPEKIEMVQSSELLPAQKKLYAAYLAELQQDTLKHLNEDGLQKHRIKILAGLTRLRQLCCHPALFVEDYRGSSAKFELLQEIVEECRGAGKRMLIFSQFTEMLGLIGRAFGEQGVPFFYLDGKTPGAERVELCSRFNEGQRDVFLISLKAGGTGLNLTGADTVILYDLWWNPAVEQQAADRAHRMGQKKVVQVIRLVAEGTVEDKMYALQQRKKSLIDEVIQPGHEAVSTLTEQELRDILDI